MTLAHDGDTTTKVSRNKSNSSPFWSSSWWRRFPQESQVTNGASPALVVAALAPMLRWQPGRNPGNNSDTTRHLSGRSVRVLAFGLALLRLASRRIRLRQAYGGQATRENSGGKLPTSENLWRDGLPNLPKKILHFNPSVAPDGEQSVSLTRPQQIYDSVPP